MNDTAYGDSSEKSFTPVPTEETSARHPEFDKFVALIATLRAPGGCPWDIKQTHESIAKNMVEEAYEAVAAIEDGDMDHLREELGDVLLEVVLQAQIASDAGEFTIDDIISDISAKIIRRHPHVFGTQAAFEAAGLDVDAVEEADDVLDLWDQVKAHERKLKEADRVRKRLAAGLDPDVAPGLLDEVPRQQPALMLAQEYSHKTVMHGFEWETIDEVWDKVYEEIAEFNAAEPGTKEAQLEFGDILFCLVNVARKQHLDAETCLRMTCAKFARRWAWMEQAVRDAGMTIDDCDSAGRENLWQQAKEHVG